MKKPIMGLAPMDGVTDITFRTIVDRYGQPSVLFTEFVPVEAIKAGATAVLKEFITYPSSTPTIAQLYGTDLEGYRIATLIVYELGFGGIDINMGCSAKSVTARGAGAGLIQNPDHAHKIIQTVKKAKEDGMNGAHSKASIPVKLKEMVERMKHNAQECSDMAISVKTRIGYGSVQTESWISELAQESLAAITIHGRTFVQGYGGKANWDEIAKAAQIIHASSEDTVVLGNGDIKSSKQAEEYCKSYGVEGVLVGRGALGNPWIFSGVTPTPADRLRVALEHAKLFVQLEPTGHFVQIRKHLGWYCAHFPQANAIHEHLIYANSLSEVESIIRHAPSEHREEVG